VSLPVLVSLAEAMLMLVRLRPGLGVSSDGGYWLSGSAALGAGMWESDKHIHSLFSLSPRSVPEGFLI